MIKIKLETETGEFVQYVAIPPFKTLPDVITWGIRTFIFSSAIGYNEENKPVATYKEAFCVAAILEWKDDINYIKKSEAITDEPILVGDDKHLHGLPNNLDEAIDDLITFYEKDLPLIIEMTEDTFSSSSHFGAGMFIRNSWFLWHQEPNTKYPSWPNTRPPLVKFFNDLGIFHADDMSAIILVSTYRKVHNLPIDLEGQIEHYKEFWKKQGFKDGIYKLDNK